MMAARQWHCLGVAAARGEDADLEFAVWSDACTCQYNQIEHDQLP
jgi:hypothetical protein